MSSHPVFTRYRPDPFISLPSSTAPLLVDFTSILCPVVSEPREE